MSFEESLYGLKHAPQCLFSKLSTALINYGFKQSLVDYSLFTYIPGELSIRVLVYVDDLIVCRTDLGMLEQFKAYLSEC